VPPTRFRSARPVASGAWCSFCRQLVYDVEQRKAEITHETDRVRLWQTASLHSDCHRLDALTMSVDKVKLCAMTTPRPRLFGLIASLTFVVGVFAAPASVLPEWVKDVGAKRTPAADRIFAVAS